MKVIVAGDFCQRYRTDIAIKNKEFEKLFEEIRPLVKCTNYSIVNFEFPLVIDSNKSRPIPKSGPNLQGTIESVEAIKYAGFNCCTLANNHILDQDEIACLDTIRELENVGIDTVGAGKNAQDAAKILYKNIDGMILAIINCCEHEFTIATDTTSGANPLNPIQQYYNISEARKNADKILIIVHGGPEFYQLPTPRMQETYRFFIDAGADVVVNHHQHCYSGYEIYNGKPIFYGLGNLCFDNPSKRNGTWNEGYMVELDFSHKKDISFHLHPYIQCNETVGVHILNDLTEFEKHINQLNAIIASKEKLKKATEKYYDQCSLSYYALHNYENKYLNKLWRMGLFPSEKTRKRLFSIWNLIECESHRDKTYFAFKKFVGKQ